MPKPIIKLFSEENVRIHVTDFELLDVSFYGCIFWGRKALISALSMTMITTNFPLKYGKSLKNTNSAFTMNYTMNISSTEAVMYRT